LRCQEKGILTDALYAIGQDRQMAGLATLAGQR